VKEQKNSPKLRFPEFKGEWERKKLGEVAAFSKGKGISKADIIENGRNKCIRYGELYTHYGETIYEIKSSTNIELKDLVLSEANDVIIPASGETQIDIATASCVLKKGVAIGGDLNIIKTKNEGVFLSYYLNYRKKYEIANLAQGISVVHLYSSQLATLNLNLPTLPEQKRIASFLTALDQKISELKQKKNLLENYKKGVMQKLFSQALRFKDENGKQFPKWEKKRLGEVLQIQGGYAFKSNLFNQGKTNVIRIGDINPNIYLGSFNGAVSQEIPDSKYLVKKNDFLMALSGATFGKVGKIKDDGIGYINQRVALFKTKECLEYFYQLAQTDEFKNYINSIPSASAQPNISNGDILNYLTATPVLPEQTKIANFLSAIDEKINRTENQLQQTQAYKKGLLQKMFV
jgi:type I restriction enzyme S subunit